MWKRGKVSRSKSWTRRPCWARSVDTVEPAGPPPMTTTSGDSEATTLIILDTDLDQRQHFDDVADGAAAEQHLGAASVQRARLAHPEDAHHLGVGGDREELARHAREVDAAVAQDAPERHHVAADLRLHLARQRRQPDPDRAHLDRPSRVLLRQQDAAVVPGAVDERRERPQHDASAEVRL